MAETLSSMKALGYAAPDFHLLDVRTHKMVSLHELKSPIATVIMFICNHCPYVKHIQKKLVDVANKYKEKNISFIAISSNDAEKYPADAPDKMKIEAEKNDYPFPYLYDETQKVARDYLAACTPDFFIFDNQLHCVYQGRFDAATPGNQKPVTGEDLSNALDHILANKPVDTDQKPSMGCNIKWKK
ncbi:MAG: thioredoxin family protein [Gammaproteobacteria bacterium]|nr:thioredoxin family protein [Gammaproteobacteria bacterium]